MHHGDAISLSVIGDRGVRITLASGVTIAIYDDSSCTTGGVEATVAASGGSEPVRVDGAADGRDAADRIMRDLVEAWAADAARRGLSPRYIEQQRARVGHLAAFAGVAKRDKAWQSVAPEQIRAWLSHLAEHGMPHPHRPAKPCSPKTLNNHLSAVRKFFRWSIKAGHIDHDPTAGIEWARVRTNKGRVLSGPQAWAIFHAAQQDEASPDPRCRDKHGRVIVRSPFYRVLIATGMRAGAAEGLRVRDFLLTAEPPRVVIRADTAKNRAEQEIIISAADRDYFAEVLSGRPPGERALFRPHYKVLQSDAKAAGIPVKDDRDRGVGFHCFRRWHGTEMDRLGFSLEQIRQRLGHKTHLSTMGYLVRELEEQQGVAETLAKISPKSVDAGDRIADDLNAKTGSPNSQTKFNGETPARAGLRKSNRAGVPVEFGPTTPGRLGGFNGKGGQQAPLPPDQSGRQDLNLSPDRDRNARDGISLLHRMLDLLEKNPPGRKAEGHDEAGEEDAGPGTTRPRRT